MFDIFAIPQTLVIMLSVLKVIKYVNNPTLEIELIQRYFEKSSEGLKDLNARSVRVTQYVMVLVVIHFFQKNFTHIKIFEFEFDTKVLILLTPTLISYLLFEWLMMAKRRRDLVFGVQQASYRLFKIVPNTEDRYFPGFDPNTLNIMPYSFMCEVLTVDDESGGNRRIYLWATRAIFIILLVILGTSFWEYWTAYGFEFRFNLPTSIQDIIEIISFYTSFFITLLFIGWIIYYYHTEFKNKNEIFFTSKGRISRIFTALAVWLSRKRDAT